MIIAGSLQISNGSHSNIQIYAVIHASERLQGIKSNFHAALKNTNYNAEPYIYSDRGELKSAYYIYKWTHLTNQHQI